MACFDNCASCFVNIVVEIKCFAEIMYCDTMEAFLFQSSDALFSMVSSTTVQKEVTEY